MSLMTLWVILILERRRLKTFKKYPVTIKVHLYVSLKSISNPIAANYTPCSSTRVTSSGNESVNR